MERIPIDVRKLTEEQKRALAKQVMKLALAQMTPEQQKIFLKNLQKVEINRRMQKHKLVVEILSVPAIPIAYMIQALKVLILKKVYIKQALMVAKNYKLLKELASSQSKNIISPERAREEENKKKVKEYKDSYTS